ncbi:MAG: hypothetical protein J2P41_19225 [Blastocatellia bacterium]|nr:hypothetical protein [Blastocatellia bacterium]
MRLNERAGNGILLTAIIAAALIASVAVKRGISMNESSGSSCHFMAAQDAGQDPGEEEGNPTHRRPEKNCNNNPTKQEVDCHCKTDCNPDGSPKEDRRCKSYCHKDKCSCPRKPCD